MYSYLMTMNDSYSDPMHAYCCIVLYLPGTEKETPWHHDQAYYPVDGEAVVSIWMPVGRDQYIG